MKNPEGGEGMERYSPSPKQEEWWRGQVPHLQEERLSFKSQGGKEKVKGHQSLMVQRWAEDEVLSEGLAMDG